MVSLQAFLAFLATCCFKAILALPIEERSLADITADFEVLIADLSVINDDLNGLSETGVPGVNSLTADSLQFIEDVQQTTSDIAANGFIDEDDIGPLRTNEILPAASDVINVLNTFVVEEPTLVNLASEVPNLIQNTETSLENMAANVQELISTLDENIPTDVVAEDAAVRTSVQLAFATAIAAYSS